MNCDMQIHEKNVAIHVIYKGSVHRLNETHVQIYNKNVFWKCEQKIHFVGRESPKPTNIMKRVLVALIQWESELKPQSYLVLHQTAKINTLVIQKGG